MRWRRNPRDDQIRSQIAKKLKNDEKRGDIIFYQDGSVWLRRRKATIWPLWSVRLRCQQKHLGGFLGVCPICPSTASRMIFGRTNFEALSVDKRATVMSCSVPFHGYDPR